MGDYPPPRIVETCGADRRLWGYPAHHYHYLGRPKLVEEHLEQLVFIAGQVVGCLGWRVRPGRARRGSGGSAGVWQRSARDCIC